MFQDQLNFGFGPPRARRVRDAAKPALCSFGSGNPAAAAAPAANTAPDAVDERAHAGAAAADGAGIAIVVRAQCAIVHQTREVLWKSLVFREYLMMEVFNHETVAPASTLRLWRSLL